MILVVSAVNQKLIEEGLRLRLSLVVESGQIASSHHVAAVLGFGASAVYPLGVQFRAEEKFGGEADKAFKRFAKAAEKSLMKTMGKVGLCTAESYIGGEFFEPNFLDTNDRVLKRYFPNVKTPVGGVNFKVIAAAVADWHAKALTVQREDDIPLLGLFKERAEGAGHSFGTAAVRGFIDMTEEKIGFERPGASPDILEVGHFVCRDRADIDEGHDADRLGDADARLGRGRDIGTAAEQLVAAVTRRDLLIAVTTHRAAAAKEEAPRRRNIGQLVATDDRAGSELPGQNEALFLAECLVAGQHGAADAPLR